MHASLILPLFLLGLTLVRISIRGLLITEFANETETSGNRDKRKKVVSKGK